MSAASSLRVPCRSRRDIRSQPANRHLEDPRRALHTPSSASRGKERLYPGRWILEGFYRLSKIPVAILQRCFILGLEVVDQLQSHPCDAGRVGMRLSAF
jgi:hypothetical protein